MRRIGLAAGALGVAAALTLTLGACTTGGGAAEGDSLTLTVWDNGEVNRAGWTALSEAFNASHDTQIEIETISNDSYDQVLKTRLQGGEGPDLFGVHPVSLPDLEAGGYVRDVANDDFFSKFYPAAQEQYLVDGKAYTFPIAKSIQILVYNRDLFDAAGITETPTTYSEFLEVCEKLKVSGVTPYALSAKDSWFPQIPIYQSTMQLVDGPNPDWWKDNQAGEASFMDTPGWHTALERFQTLITDYGMPDPLGTGFEASVAAFMQSKAAMFPAEIVIPDAIASDMNIGTFIAPMAEADEEPQFVGGGYGPLPFAINANSKNPEAALEFVDFMYQEENYQPLLKALGWFSAVEGVEADNGPIYNEIQAQVEGKEPPYNAWPADHFNKGVSDVFLSAVQDLIADRASVDDVLTRMDQANDEAIAEQ